MIYFVFILFCSISFFFFFFVFVLLFVVQPMHNNFSQFRTKTKKDKQTKKTTNKQTKKSNKQTNKKTGISHKMTARDFWFFQRNDGGDSKKKNLKNSINFFKIHEKEDRFEDHNFTCFFFFFFFFLQIEPIFRIALIFFFVHLGFGATICFE